MHYVDMISRQQALPRFCFHVAEHQSRLRAAARRAHAAPPVRAGVLSPRKPSDSLDTRAGATGLQAIAPIDDGTDACDVAERLLRAVHRLAEVHLLVNISDEPWRWQGRVGDTTLVNGHWRLDVAPMFLTVDPERTIAVSYCTGRGVSGVRLYDNVGPFLTLWSEQAVAFDLWLGHAVPGFGCQEDKAGSAAPL